MHAACRAAGVVAGDVEVLDAGRLVVMGAAVDVDVDLVVDEALEGGRRDVVDEEPQAASIAVATSANDARRIIPTASPAHHRWHRSPSRRTPVSGDRAS